MLINKIITFLLLNLLLIDHVVSQNPSFKNLDQAGGHVTAEIITDRDTILLNNSLTENPVKIGVLFNIEDGWHIYGQDPGDAGQPTKISFFVSEKNNPISWKTREIKWPETETFLEKGDIKTFGYTKSVLGSSELIIPPIIPNEESELNIRAEVSWLMCLDRCIPGKAVLEKTLKLSSTSVEEAPKNEEIFKTFGRVEKSAYKHDEGVVTKEEDKSIFFFLISAFVGGLILNLMPCVLPVLSLKLFSLVNIKSCDNKKRRSELFWYTAGILLSFNIISALVLILKKIGTPVGWGFQFQNLSFVYILTLLIFILSLKFFNLKLPGVTIHHTCADYIEKQKVSSNKIKNLFDGVLVTILSTPCTAPILGSAIGFALSRSSLESFLIFNFIGLGLASPYVFLSSSKKALSIIPKPGPWMDTFREILGLCMIGTVIWLLGVQESLQPGTSLSSMLLLFIIFCLAKWYGINNNKFIKILLLIFFILATSYFLPKTLDKTKISEINNISKKENSNVTWKIYSEELIEKTNGAIFIDFTASWCITCKYNETFILSNAEILNEFHSKNITLVKADWTDGSKEISDALNFYGGNGVPHYVLLDKSKGIKEILPTLLTKDIIKNYLAKIK